MRLQFSRTIRRMSRARDQNLTCEVVLRCHNDMLETKISTIYVCVSRVYVHKLPLMAQTSVLIISHPISTFSKRQRERRMLCAQKKIRLFMSAAPLFLELDIFFCMMRLCIKSVTHLRTCLSTF
jgi:hypothetical protein